jgi:hypothetical protein
MSAYFTGKMILFLRSVLWDLGVPQEAATILYEDNDACTAMANAQKPMPRTRHMEIKYFSLSEWVPIQMQALQYSQEYLGSLPRPVLHTALPTRESTPRQRHAVQKAQQKSATQLYLRPHRETANSH